MPDGDKPHIVWTPTERQSEFLSAPDDEVLYGGAAGGGKSDCLLVDALGLPQSAVLRPRYRAVLFRRSFPELRDLIDRSRSIYPVAAPGAEYSEAAREWRFPSGAKIEFGYCESDQDRYRYQGREYQYVGWDELTQWATDLPYRFLLSRLRSTDPQVKCYVRATCNPGGPGHEWVRAYWQIPDDGSATAYTEVVETRHIKRRFVPARLSDNPHLAGSGYRERLLTLSTQQRRALLEGRWDVVDIEGSIYAEQLQEAYSQGRVTDLPIERGIPVDTYWDLGRNDTTAIWFRQRAGLQNRFIGYYEANGKQITAYADVLRDMAREHGWNYGVHYLPHDAEVTDLSAAESRLSLLEAAGVIPNHVVARCVRIEDGIEQTRQKFGSCWFDRARCKDGLKALQSYRRAWDESRGVFRPIPLHDWASNGADAFRQFGQAPDLSYGPAPVLKMSKTRSWVT